MLLCSRECIYVRNVFNFKKTIFRNLNSIKKKTKLFNFVYMLERKSIGDASIQALFKS